MGAETVAIDSPPVVPLTPGNPTSEPSPSATADGQQQQQKMFGPLFVSVTSNNDVVKKTAWASTPSPEKKGEEAEEKTNDELSVAVPATAESRSPSSQLEPSPNGSGKTSFIRRFLSREKLAMMEKKDVEKKQKNTVKSSVACSIM